MKTLTVQDICLYVWLGLFWLCLCLGFPPLVLAFAALPAIHSRRAARRRIRRLR